MNNTNNDDVNNIINKINKNSFYITTPIYYVSGEPHLGHAYTSIACDVLARWNRNGKKVFFLTGTDEHGQKIEKKAKENNQSPKKFVNNLIPKFKNLLTELNISNDYFIRTTNEKHKLFIQEMLQKSFDNGDIYKDNYEGLYCVDCEQYYKEDDLLEGNICPIHKRKVSLIKEEAYFFKLSKYQKKLLDLYKYNEEFLSPKSKSLEIINRVEEGLQDVCISRNKENLSWGIELPFDKNHVAYVWFDALFNYISALKINNNFEEFWPANVHVIGKDIMWFHTVYWPAFLMSVGFDLPKKVYSHGWWTVNGEKMGKSMGNVIEPLKIAKEFGVDEFRFFMLANGSFGDDIDFTYGRFANKINNELNNDLGNLVSRIHAMTNKYFDGIIPKSFDLTKEDEEFISKLNIFDKFNEQIQNLQFNQAIETLWSTIRETNAYINKTAPYKEKDEKRLSTIMNIFISSIELFAKYINCFMPEKSKMIFKQFNFINEDKPFNFDFKLIKDGIKLNEKENLFSKIKLEKKEDKNNLKGNENKGNDKGKVNGKTRGEEKREGFSSLNLKVGKIIEIKKHPDSDRMFVEKIDLGEEEPRIIVSGLKKYYNLDEMRNKKVIVVCNLKPAKLRGVKSEGMVLVSQNESDDTLGLLLSDAKVGTHLKCGEEISDNPFRIKVDKIFEMDFKADGEYVLFNGKRVEVNEEGKSLKIDRKINGDIC